jgi:hypothetical protein
MRDLAELNIVNGGRPDRKPPTELQIKEFEAAFGVKLPDDYISLLKFKNGGCPTLRAFKPKELKDYWTLEYYCYLADRSDHIEGLWAWTKAWRQALSQRIVAIGDDGGGIAIVLVFVDNNHSVKLCLDDFRLLDVADSLGEFIDMLTTLPVG